MKKYVFDLDNTLIYTDSLNNDAYNHALNEMGLAPIKDCKRITRNIVFARYSHLNNVHRNELINLKQKFFIHNLNCTVPNSPILDLLKQQKKDNCVLWTSSEEIKVKALLEYYQISDRFLNIVYSGKQDIPRDLEIICTTLSCPMSQLIFYEDNQEVYIELSKLELDTVYV